METVFGWWVPVLATFMVAFTSGYLIGMFTGHEQAARQLRSAPKAKTDIER